MKNLVLYSFIFLLFFGGSNGTSSLTYKPIYISNDLAKTITFESPREMITQGKIYIKDNLIFIGDIDLGVHIIDNSNPENPQKIGFLTIYGNHDIAVKGDILYADNFEDLVAINISDYRNPYETQRMKNVYQLHQSNYPPDVPYHTYFECVDPSKGYVIGWEQAAVSDPHCYTNY